MNILKEVIEVPKLPVYREVAEIDVSTRTANTIPAVINKIDLLLRVSIG
jgi:hypothetical protein